MSADAAALKTVLDTANRLIAQTGYAAFTMTALARESGLPLAALYRLVPDRVALLAAFLSETDVAVLDHLPEWSAADSPRDRLFDLLLARLEHMEGRRAMTRVILRDLRRLPVEALALAPKVIGSMRWMVEAAGLLPGGLKGEVRLRALAGAYASILPVWLKDEEGGLAKTMAALDRRLRQIEKLWPDAFGAPAQPKTPQS